MKVKRFKVIVRIFLCIFITIIFIGAYWYWRDIRYEEKVSIDLGNGIYIELKHVQSGSFIMGSDAEIGDSDETPKRKVNITNDFYVGLYEVTQEQWKQVMGYNPSEFIGDKKPVENVSFEECQMFLEKLSYISKEKFRLPTEAEWEYVCRAGSNTKWFCGESEKDLEKYAWIDSNSEEETHEVGSKLANPWGIYDIYGNVQEWCSDWYKNPYEEEEVNPVGPYSGESKVIRGGAWGDFADNARSAYRNANGKKEKNNGTGFRVIMEISK